MHELLQDLLDEPLFADPGGKLISIGSRGIDEILPMKELLTPAEAFGEEHLLPLPDHAVALIVEEERLHRQIVVRHRFHLAEVHAQAAIAINVDDQFVRMRELRTDRRRQAKAHRPHRARCQE